MNQILETINSIGAFNIILLLCLMVEGYIIKHYANSVPNKYIPFILMITGILVVILGAITNGMDIGVIVNGVIAALVATGSHQVGKISWVQTAEVITKNIRKNMNLPEQGDTEYVQKELNISDNQLAKISAIEQTVSSEHYQLAELLAGKLSKDEVLKLSLETVKTLLSEFETKETEENELVDIEDDSDNLDDDVDPQDISDGYADDESEDNTPEGPDVLSKN